MKTLYTAIATTSGGRDGSAKSSDGNLSVELATPKELGGSGKVGTNPEQLFAAGYAACFENAVLHVARRLNITIAESSATAHVHLSPSGTGGFKLSVDMHIKLPGLDRSQAEELVAKADEVCPYSNAVRGNIDVNLTID